jgi:response regulator RpfG family c-di-GMP phosphodiesterase
VQVSAGRRNAQARNRTVGAVLVAGKAITPEQCDWLVKDSELTLERIEDAVIYRGLMSELDLLKFLAAHYKTRFVSTERLSKAEIDRATLAMIPRAVAETFGVFPVMFDPDRGTLSVVTAEPDDAPVLKEIQSTSAAREIKAFLARPAAVRAAIAKFHSADPHAFALLTHVMQYTQQSTRAGNLDRASDRAASLRIPGSRHASITLELDENPMGVRAHPGSPQVGSPLPPAPATSTAPKAAAIVTPSGAPNRSMPPPLPKRRVSAPSPSSPSSPSTEPRAITSIRPSEARATLPPGPPSGAGPRVDPAIVGELVNVLVALLDSHRQDLRGHSSLVARLVRRLCERLNLPSAQAATITLGAQLHDVGKAGPVHLTPINVSEYESYRAAAQKALMTPTRLLGSANVAAEALEAIEQMYERYDGKGIPNGLAGKEIALGARIIAVADAYADLVENASNAFRRQLPPQEACAALMKYKATVFDPHLVDLFKSLILGDDVRAKLLSDRHRALLVDPDAEETTILELRLLEQGFEVRTVRSAESALEMLGAREFDIVVSELDLGKTDGLALLKQARAQRWGQNLGWVIYTRRVVRDDAERAFDLGVLDFVAKPAQPDVLVAKFKAMLEQRSTTKKSLSGVSGSLREMALPDLLQVLSQGRKTGRLNIQRAGDAGGIHFDAGAVVGASWNDLAAHDAVYAMLKIDDGDFAFDPDFRPQASERAIHESSEALLLEGLRRRDEGL